MRDFAPRETGPDGEANGNSGVEVATGHWCTSDDRESDSYGERPTDLEERAENGNAYFACNWIRSSERELWFLLDTIALE